jgi:Ca-activated chloride channel family protein
MAMRLHNQLVKSFRTRQQRKRRGAMAVFILVLLSLFLVAVAFSLDVGYMQLTRTQLRTATDASARAAGEALSRTEGQSEEEAMETARAAAKSVAAENLVAGDPLGLFDADIVFGNSTRQDNGSWDFVAEGTPLNSVRVFGLRTEDSASGSVNLFFGKLLGRDFYEPKQSSTVVRLDRDICLVVDRSSSMKLYLSDTSPLMSTRDSRFCQAPHATLSRWAALHAAVDEFLVELENTPQLEYVGLASYASNYSSCSTWSAESEINLQVSTSHTVVSNAIDTLSSRVWNGATNISAGLDAGVVALTNPSTTRPFAAKTMVLFTDGHATHGRPLPDAANDAANKDITIHTVTFGDGANQSDMLTVAEITGGNHYHAPDAATLKEIFREIALTLPIVFTD